MAHSRRRFLRHAATAASATCVAPGILARPPASKSTAMKSSEAIEAALTLLAPTGPEYHGGLANHGPMAAEALVALQRPDAVVPWVEMYRKRLNEHPTGLRPVDAKSWREALGVQGRVGDWIVFFRRELEKSPWKDVLGEWTARLAPGVVAAAFHGAIRTAHAVRTLEAVETPARVHELAEGLGYWAATYNALPEVSPPARPVPHRRPSGAIAEVPELPAGRRVSNGNIVERLAPLDAFPPFAAVADAVDPSGDSGAFLSDLTETFASVYLASVPPGSVITFIHGVTGPAAVRTLLPYLSPEEQARLLRYTWQACASFASSNGFQSAPRPAEGPLPTRDELADRAIATNDEHAIKFTDACFREYALNPKTVYIRAARDGVARLG
jgi:questin oxidase-like protein